MDHYKNDDETNNLIKMGKFFYTLSCFQSINNNNLSSRNSDNIKMNSNQQDLFNLNLNNYDDDETLEQQLHFNQILSQLIENYENIDKSYKAVSHKKTVTSYSMQPMDSNIDHGEDDIICLDTESSTNPKQASNSNSSPSNKNSNNNKNEDDDICFLYEEEAPTQSSKVSNYYDNDGDVDEQEVMKRWRCKKLSNPYKNLSKSNYRLRLFNEKNAKQASERRFKKCIFSNSSSSAAMSSKEKPVVVPQINKSNTKQVQSFNNGLYLDFNSPIKDLNFKLPSSDLSLNQFDKKNNNCSSQVNKENEEIVLNKRIEDIRKKYSEREREVQMKFNVQKENLSEVYRQQLSMLQIIFEQEKANCAHDEIDYVFNEFNEKQIVCRNLYIEALTAVRNEFKNDCRHIKDSEKSQIDALKLIYQSGKYEKGKLDQYCTVTIMQPTAKRRRYWDDGRRQVLLPEEKLRNIIIEDTIYAYYYGEPF